MTHPPQDTRPRKIRFTYAESPTKRTHSREGPSTGQNPRALGRIRSLLAGVSRPGLWALAPARRPLAAHTLARTRGSRAGDAECRTRARMGVVRGAQCEMRASSGRQGRLQLQLTVRRSACVARARVGGRRSFGRRIERRESARGGRGGRGQRRRDAVEHRTTGPHASG